MRADIYVVVVLNLRRALRLTTINVALRTRDDDGGSSADARATACAATVRSVVGSDVSTVSRTGGDVVDAAGDVVVAGAAAVRLRPVDVEQDGDTTRGSTIVMHAEGDDDDDGVGAATRGINSLGLAAGLYHGAV